MKTLRHMTGWAITLAAAFMIVPQTGQATDFSAWSHKAKITLSGYSKSDTLVNFPVLVVLNTGIQGMSYADFASSSGGDLRFSSSSSNELNYEVEQWNTNGSSYLWVQVPSISGTNTAIWAHWGNGAATSPAYTTNGATWSEGYAGVWHFNDTDGTQRDSSGHGLSGSCENGVSQGVSGKIGGCIDLDGNNDYVNIPNGYTSTIKGDDTCAIELWMAPDSYSSYPVLLDAPDLSYFGFFFELDNSGGLYWSQGSGSANYRHYGSVAIPLSSWSYTAIAKTGTTSGDLLVNGAVQSSYTGNFAASENGNSALLVGKFVSGSYATDGKLDELRISSVERSADWLWASWMNAASNSVFNSYGAVEAAAVEAEDGPVFMIK